MEHSQNVPTLATVASSIQELTEAVVAGFVRVETEIKDIKQELSQKADRSDVANMGKEIRGEMELLRDDVNIFTSDIYDELSGRITVLENKHN